MLFYVLLFALATFAGGTAAVVGFGIGSFLTPVLALKTGFGTAVAAVGIAHFLGTAVRYWLLRKEVNRRVLFSFGMLCAATGLLGAALQAKAPTTALAVIFGSLMVLAGLSNLLGWTDKLNIKGPFAWLAGALSGFFGGMVGNQGGLRATGLLGFRLTKTQFVATTTAVALMVDLLRVPVYIAARSHQLRHLAAEIGVMSAGVIVGTLVGAPLLRRLPVRYFKVILAVILILVGALVVVGH